MKRLFIMSLLLLSLTAEAQTPLTTLSTISTVVNVTSSLFGGSKTYQIRVEAYGNSSEDARQNGFRRAIQQAGQLVLTESESDGKRLLRDDVLLYSGKYIDNFTVISDGLANGKYKVVMDVYVSDEKITRGLESIGYAKGGKIDGDTIKKEWDRMETRVQSERERKRNGERLVEFVMKRYPKRALDLEVTKTSVKRDEYGNASFIYHIDYKFNSGFIEALDQSIRKSRDGAVSLTKNGKVVDSYKVNMSTGFMNWGGAWAVYYDGTVQNTLITNFAKPFAIKVTFKDHKNGDKPFVLCQQNVQKDLDGQLFGWMMDYQSNRPTDIYSIGDRTTSFYYTLENTFGWTAKSWVNWISGYQKIEATVADSFDCKEDIVTFE
jgi:hypothetical protein